MMHNIVAELPVREPSDDQITACQCLGSQPVDVDALVQPWLSLRSQRSRLMLQETSDKRQKSGLLEFTVDTIYIFTFLMVLPFGAYR